MKVFFGHKQRHNAFCAFCRTPRRVMRKRNIGLTNIIASVLMATVITVVLWQGFDPRGFVIFVVGLAFAEVFVQLRWRLSIVCRACGFDPALYLKDPTAAARKVKDRLDQRKEDPSALLGRPLNLPALAPERAEEVKKLAEAQSGHRGGLVSRSV